MRETVGSTWIYGLVITFTLIFSGFLVLTISYARAYRMKNEITTIIEKYEGITTYEGGSIEIINNYLKNNGYRSEGGCPVEPNSYGAKIDSGIELAESKNKYNYCLGTEIANGYAYFTVTVFYDFNLPVFGKLGKYSITGKTKSINHYNLPNKK